MGAHRAPRPSKVTADITTCVKEDQVAVIERDGLRLGTSSDAGALCVTSKKPKGITGDMYRFYVRTQGAPGPYKEPHPITGVRVSARDENGRELFDLDAVERWNAARPGMGARIRTDQPVRWTATREFLITAARDGQLVLSLDGRPFHEAKELDPREVQRVGELVAVGLLERPELGAGKYRPTTAGLGWLADPPEKETRLRRAENPRRPATKKRARRPRRATPLSRKAS